MEIKKAKKSKVKLKIGFAGASGFGKTYSALLMAYGICGDWNKIVVIDTENDSSSLYSDLAGADEFSSIQLQAPFSPERYIQAIQLAENSGFEVCIIDSISHEWEGTGGCLEIHQQLGGQFSAWAKVTPRHNQFINSILQSNMHIISTVRKKQDYDLIKNEKGKVEPVKVGTKEVTRDGYEYELTLNLELINDKHLCRASKDRTSLFMDQPEFVPSIETGKRLIEWANKGVDLNAERESKINAYCDSITAVTSRLELESIYAEITANIKNDPRILAALKNMGECYPKQK